MQHTGNGQQIVDVEPTDQRARHGVASTLDSQVELHTLRGEPHVFGPDRRVIMPVRAHADAADAIGNRAEMFETECVVEVDDHDGDTRQREDLRLLSRILLHRAVVVEVIPGEVRERDDVELDAVDPALLEGVRADLHRDLLNPSGHEIGKELVNRRHLGRRHAHVDPRVAGHPGTERADGRGLGSQRLPCLGEEVRCRGLAVGSRDAHHGHGARRMTAEIVGHTPQYSLQPGHCVHAVGQRGVCLRRIHQHGRCTTLQCVMHPRQRRSAGAPKRDENIAGLERTAVLHKSTAADRYSGERRVVSAQVEVVLYRTGPRLAV